MPSTVSQINPSSASRQSQIGGWTVLREPQPSPANDTEDSDAVEENASPTTKRKAKNHPPSSRPAKSPRISGGRVPAWIARPSGQSRDSLGSIGELQSVGHRLGASNTSSVPQRSTNLPASQPKASGSRNLPDKRNSPPLNSPTRTRPLLSSKSVPSLPQGSSSSQPSSKSKAPVDRAGSSSSDSLPDPIALVSSYRSALAKSKQNEADRNEMERGIGGSASRKGPTAVSTSSTVSQKKFLSKSRPSLVSDDEPIVISSDSDDGARTLPRKSTKGRPSQQGKSKTQGSKTYLTNADGAIDLTSDTDMPNIARSRPVGASQATLINRGRTEGELPMSSGVETASRLLSSTALTNQRVSSPLPAVSGPSQITSLNQLPRESQLPETRSAFALPLQSNVFEVQKDCSGGVSLQTAHSAPVPSDTFLSDSSVSQTKPAGISYPVNIALSSMEGNDPETSHSGPRNRPSLSSRVSEPPESSTKTSQITKKLAPPPVDAEVIDLCSDSDEAMEVDDLLASNMEPPGAGAPSAAIPSVIRNQGNGKAPAVPRTYALPLPQPSPQPFPPQPSSPLPQSSSAIEQFNLIHRESFINGPKEDLAFVPQGSTFAEASAAADDISSDLPSSSLASVVGAHSRREVPPSSPLIEDPASPGKIPGSITSEASEVRTSPEGAISREASFEISETEGIMPPLSKLMDVIKRRNASAGPSRLPMASTAHPASVNRTYKTSTTDTPSEISSDGIAEDPTETLVAPVLDMHLQTEDRGDSPDPLDTFVSDNESMDVDMPPGSVSQKSTSERPSPISSSPVETSTASSSESSGPSIQHARKTTGKPRGTDRSKNEMRSDTSERDDFEEHGDTSLNASPSRHVIFVKEPDFSKLRADNPSALDDAGSLSDAIQWPAEKIPTELHDMLNHLPANYHHNPQMRYIFESMMEENTAEDEPTSPRIEIYSGQNGPVCPPWEFYYTNRILYGKGVPRSDKKLLKGCDCDGPCNPNSETCACAKRQRGWTGDDKSIKGFLYNKKGKILNPGYPIFECNDNCECSEECMNRVIQNGRQHQISICLTNGKGWGVYADEKIPRGTYLGIYSGEMLLESEAGERGKLYDKYGRTYLFDLDFYYLHSLEADKQKASTSKHDGTHSASQGSMADKDDEKSNLYTIDAFHVGNFTRFLNHSCDPNCVITPSYVNEPDLQKPTLTIFTTRDVKKGDELCFSYFGNGDDEDEEEDQVDEHGQKKKVVGGPGTHTAKAIHRPCLCGAPNCRGKMF